MLSKDGTQPLVQSAIPQETSLPKMSTYEAIDLARQWTDPALSVEEYLLGHIGKTPQSEKIRIRGCQALKQYALPVNVKGQQVFQATVRSDMNPSGKSLVPG